VAGAGLDIRALAQAMVAVEAYAAVQLDINPYWVHMTAFEPRDGRLEARPLDPGAMTENVARYLEVSVRDFFYVTTRP
jgi:hypothetical protein